MLNLTTDINEQLKRTGSINCGKHIEYKICNKIYCLILQDYSQHIERRKICSILYRNIPKAQRPKRYLIFIPYKPVTRM